MYSLTQSVWLAVAAVMVAVYVPLASAQSLGAVADKEEARRKRVAKPGKVYTNETLGRGGEAAPPASGSAPATGATPKPQDPPKPAPEDDRKKDEAHWRGRITKARDGLQRARMFQEALQTRINSLSADFTSRDDPAQRALVAQNRQKALAELERVTSEISAFEKEIRDIEEEARKAGVPPGWLR
jgi:hypothetical protein